MTFSRRSFLLGVGSFFLAPAAFAKKAKIAPQIKVGGPRTLARQEWPPAITPEYVGVADKGYACFADDMGRLALVDLKREDNPAVLGELSGIGRRVLSVAITPYRAFAVVQVETASDVEHLLVTISLSPPTDLTVMSKIPLDNFAEPTCVAAAGDLIAVGGLGPSGKRLVALYGLSKKKGVEPALVSQLIFDQVPVKLDLQEKQLLVLSGHENTDISVVNVTNPRAPEMARIFKLDGAYNTLARYRELVMVAGRGADRNYQARLLTLKPNLAPLRDVTLRAVTDVLDIAAQKGQFLLLVASGGGRQSVLPVTVGKKNEVAAGNAVSLPAGKRGSSPRARIAVMARDAYIASDWGGVQVLSVSKQGWQFSYSHTIPRLPAAALAIAGERAVIACADLKVYDISDPTRLTLLDTTDTGNIVRSMAAVGRSVLCLSRDTLVLRPVDKLSSTLGQASLRGDALACDAPAGRAYVIAGSEKKTVVTPCRVTEESLRQEAPFEVTGAFRRGFAVAGKLLLVGVHDVGLFSGDGQEELGRRSLPNLAVRDFAMTSRFVVLSCVDENLRGSCVVLSLPDLNLLGSTDLPHDAAVLACSGGKAVVAGRDKAGKDNASLVSLADPARPSVLETFPVLEAASAVTISDAKAFIAGRGLEIISLS